MGGKSKCEEGLLVSWFPCGAEELKVGHLKDVWQIRHCPAQGGAAATEKQHHFKLSYKFVFLKDKTIKAVHFCNLRAMQLVDPFHVLTDFICLSVCL